MIGRFFPEINDRLLNTLQLRKAMESEADSELLEASIEQRTRQLIPVPFINAIQFRKNRKYIKYVLPTVLIIILFLFISPGLITEPTYRILHHNRHFEKDLPYRIEVVNERLEAIQQDDFTLSVRVIGELIPVDIYIEFENSEYRLSRKDKNSFYYEFKNLQKDVEFTVSTEDFTSRRYYLRVLPKPIILNFELSLDYPSYTGKKDEILENIGDVAVPAGTSASWKFYTRDAEGVIFKLLDFRDTLKQAGSNVFSFTRRLIHPEAYSIGVFNRFLASSDSLSYFIQTIPDLYPVIFIEEYRDTAISNALYFKGLIKDDYGFNKLDFIYQVLGTESGVKQEIPIEPQVAQHTFYHQLNLGIMGLQPGQEIEYYFEVWDNDGISGSKMTRSERMYYKVPTVEEIEQMTEEAGKAIMNEMEQAVNDALELKNQIDKMREKMVNEETVSWDNRQQLEELIQQHLDLQKRIDNIRQENIDKNIREQHFKEINEEIKEKQEQLENLLNEILTDEMKALLEEIKQMLKNIDKEKVNELLEKMENSAEQISEELDRSLEWIKQLEFDKKLTETIEKLNRLASEQEELSNKSESKQEDIDQIEQAQEELNKAFEEIRKDLDEVHEKNQALEQPNPMINTDTSEEAINQEMKNSSELLEKNQRKKASQSQKNASQQMQELSDLLFNMQQMMSQESLGEDIEALRQILDNLVQLSFDQEEIMNDVTQVNITDPEFPQLIQRQHQLGNDLDMVKDSLYALSKRQMAIQPFVTREIETINRSSEEAISFLSDRRKPQAASKQQYVMTSVNNLALLLSEAMEEMQQNMSMASSSCQNSGKPKPGQGKPNAKTMSELQQQLNQSLEQLKKGQGQKDQSMGQQSMSEQLARLAAQQEALRRQLQQLMDQKKGETGSGDADLSRIMEEMERTEMELVNKMITDETLKRQKEILTRLLQHEKAEKEREKEERRESTEAKNPKISNPDSLFEYKYKQSKEAELLKTIPPKLKPYYKLKVTQYFYKFID
ncbi:MAG: hypothetical protein KKA81_02115 [Bacteroidetes bacterium]|nr:hypothetical protein [Bacteroidota bacterium]